MRLASFVVVASAAACACTLVTGAADLEPSLDPGALESGDAGGPGAPGGDAALDSSADAPPAVAPVDIVDVGTASRSTGLANQHHLVWAPGAGRWVLFYFTSEASDALRTKLSADFSSWTDGPELALPHSHGGEGRNLAVARATIDGRDLFHLALSFRVAADDHREYDVRAVFAGATLAFDAPAEVTRSSAKDNGLDVDGPAVAVTGDGFVTHFTGYRTNNPDGSGGTGNAYVLRSSDPDTGGTFSPSWSNTTIEVVGILCNARAAAVPAGGAGMLTFYEKGDDEPNPRNVRWSALEGSSWSGRRDVFDGAARMDPNDWGVLATSDGDVHVVRRTVDGALEHRRWNGSDMAAGGTVPSQVLEEGAGLALAPGDGAGMVLAGVSSSEAIVGTTWDGTAFAPWITLASPVAGARRWLTAGGIAGGPAALVWTENRGASHVIAGIRIR